jgi:hypothetical protein
MYHLIEGSDEAMPGKGSDGTLDLHSRLGPVRLDPGRHIPEGPAEKGGEAMNFGLLTPKLHVIYLDLRCGGSLGRAKLGRRTALYRKIAM